MGAAAPESPQPTLPSFIQTLLVYSPKSSNRLTYTLKTLLAEGLGLDLRTTAQADAFRQSDLPKINYSTETTLGGIQIQPNGILFETGLRDLPLEVSAHPHYYKIFFKTAGDLPFDLFGAAFWLLSRYEEYLPHRSDHYQRFHFRSSLAWQYQFLDQPLVNVWLEQLKNVLRTSYPQLTIAHRNYNFLSSIDIDNVYKYKHKGFVRTLAGLVAERSVRKALQRLRIALHKEKDPFDCYDFLIQAHRQAGVEAIYFLLLGDYGPNDKNHSATNLPFQVLMKHLADYSLVGIHPSFGSNNSLHQLKVEINRLSNIVHRTITHSRQHFAVLHFPHTYQQLLQAGIDADYSMGYPNCNGFRASYCYPYRWYDLEIESQSALTIHPFCLTESSLSAEALLKQKTLDELARPWIDVVKRYGGELVPIFHNDLMDADMRAFYLRFLELARGTS